MFTETNHFSRQKNQRTSYSNKRLKQRAKCGYPYYRLTEAEFNYRQKEFLSKEDLNMFKYRNEYYSKFPQYKPQFWEHGFKLQIFRNKKIKNPKQVYRRWYEYAQHLTAENIQQIRKEISKADENGQLLVNFFKAVGKARRRICNFLKCQVDIREIKNEGKDDQPDFYILNQEKKSPETADTKIKITKRMKDVPTKAIPFFENIHFCKMKYDK